MINFRFHIVSLTAVLLALGVGLVLGTTFLDNATVEVLRRQLEVLETDVDNARSRNAELDQQLRHFRDEADALDEQIGERLFAEQLAGTPVLVVAPRGTDQTLVDHVVDTLDEADADLVGTWWLTEKLRLEDDDQLSDLSGALGLSTTDADRLVRHFAVQVADVLFGATEAEPSADDAPPVPGPGEPAVSGPPGRTAPAEPEAIARLRDAGFIEYAGVEEADVVRLPASGLRIVVVSTPDAQLRPDHALLPILSDLAADGPVPVVVTEPWPEPSDADDGDDDPGPSLLARIRDDDELADRVSTVDDIDRVAGRVAVVLALEDARPGAPVIGHYGLADGVRLLPPPGDEA